MGSRAVPGLLPRGHRGVLTASNPPVGGHALRILHIDAARTWRGGQRQVLLLAQGLRARGHACVIATAPRSALGERAAETGLQVTAIAARSDIDPRGAIQLRRIIREMRPDVVHAHDARGHGLALVALIGDDTPLVVTRRVLFRPRGRLKYGRRVAHFIAVSRAVKAALEGAAVPADRISVVYSGVLPGRPPETIDWRARCGWPADTVVCGVVGAMSREKGTGDLEHVARALPPGAARRARVVMVGGAASPVRFSVGGIEGFRAGFVTAVDSAMAGLDMLWHPARSEGLGTVVLDALSLRVPVVAYAIGGIPEILEDGVTGLLVPPGDRRAFARAVTTLMDDPVRRASLGDAGPRRALEFHADRMIEGSIGVYKQVLGVRD